MSGWPFRSSTLQQCCRGQTAGARLQGRVSQQAGYHTTPSSRHMSRLYQERTSSAFLGGLYVTLKYQEREVLFGVGDWRADLI